MMKRILLALCATLFATQAIAGPWTVGEQPFAYTSAHTLGDGSNAQGGDMPMFAYEATQSPLTDEQRTPFHNVPDAGEYITQAEGATEAKARFDCNASHRNHDDPIVAPGVEGGGPHDHSWLNPGDFSTTYASARATTLDNPMLTCFGGALNPTPYWEPSMKIKLANGVVAVKKPRDIVTYYTNPNGLAAPEKTHRWAFGQDFIAGFNPADPDGDDRMWDAVAAATAAGETMSVPLTYSAMSATDRHQNTGFVGWWCGTPTSGNGSNANSPNPGSAFQPWLRNPDGTLTLSCDDNSLLHFTIHSPQCSDGVNLTSPDGRKHMAYRVIKNSNNSLQCPDGWYWTPGFSAIASIWIVDGDLEGMYLSSDRMLPIDTPADPTNPSPCRRDGQTVDGVFTYAYFCPGETMHFDLIPAWDFGTSTSKGTMYLMFENCVGITFKIDGVTSTPTPRTCGTGRVSADTSLETDFVDYPAHTGVERFFPLEDGSEHTVVDHKGH